MGKSQYRRRSFWLSNSVTRTWWYEFFCGFLVFGSLAGLVATVSGYKDDRIYKWPYGLSINTIIAIYTAIMKASIGLVISEGLGHLKWILLERPVDTFAMEVLDDSSRGPWGSARLLLHFGLKWSFLNIIPSIGAVVSILLLPIDPLAQQLVQLEGCSQLVPGSSAMISRAQVFDMAPHGPADGYGGIYDAPGRYVASAALQGLFGNAAPEVKRDCPTGNCTFADYTTLGYCSSCSDVSIGVPRCELTRPNISSNTPCDEISIPGKYRNMTLRVTDGAFEGVATLFDAPLDVATSWSTRTAEPNPLYNITVGYLFGEYGEMPSPPKVYSCMLEPCIRTYRSSIENGTVRESILQSGSLGRSVYSDSRLWEGYWSVADLECLEDRDDKVEKLTLLGYDLYESKRWLPYNVSFLPFDVSKDIDRDLENGRYEGFISSVVPASSLSKKAQIFYEPVDEEDNALWTSSDSNTTEPLLALTYDARSIIPKKCIYEMSIGTHISLNMLWDAIFSERESSSDHLDAYTISRLNMRNLGSGNGTLQDVESLMNRISESLTVAIRNNGRSNWSQPATGETKQYAICLTVRWPWISYLLVIVSLFFIFFASLVVKSRLTQARMVAASKEGFGTSELFHDYKSSLLPVLLRGGNSNRTTDLAKTAKTIQAKLTLADGSWKLILVETNDKQKDNPTGDNAENSSVIDRSLLRTEIREGQDYDEDGVEGKDRVAAAR